MKETSNLWQTGFGTALCKWHRHKNAFTRIVFICYRWAHHVTCQNITSLKHVDNSINSMKHGTIAQTWMNIESCEVANVYKDVPFTIHTKFCFTCVGFLRLWSVMMNVTLWHYPLCGVCVWVHIVTWPSAIHTDALVNHTELLFEDNISVADYNN
jgi:hypothetical protein